MYSRADGWSYPVSSTWASIILRIRTESATVQVCVITPARDAAARSDHTSAVVIRNYSPIQSLSARDEKPRRILYILIKTDDCSKTKNINQYWIGLGINMRWPTYERTPYICVYNHGVHHIYMTTKSHFTYGRRKLVKFITTKNIDLKIIETVLNYSKLIFK